MAAAAKLILVLGGVSAAIVYVVLMLVMREAFDAIIGSPIHRDPPTICLAAVALPIALIPGLALGWLANRWPRVRRLRCRNCRWSKCYPTHAIWASEPAPSRTGYDSSPFGQIRDEADPWKEATAWAYAELRSGRVPEDVEQELLSQGWPRDDVAGMVEKCRKQARYSPAAAEAARQAHDR